MLTILLIAILILSFTGTFFSREFAIKRNIIDIPNDRSSHTRPTPRGGGLAIIFAWYAGLVCLRILNLIEQNLFLSLACGIVLAVISFLDDIYDIKPVIRILFQSLTAILGLTFIGGFKTFYVGDNIFEYTIVFSCIATVGIIWFINLYNFLDGIDGYASAEAIMVALGIYLISGSPVLLVLIFAVFGFLIWNWPKAKIFMGDIGSTQLGYILIILGIYFNNNFQVNFAGWLILTSLFWFDGSLTLYLRWRNKEKLSQAHRKHYYQRIVQYGFSHKKTVIISIIINLMYILLVFISENGYISYLITFPVCILINIILANLIDRRQPFQLQ
jgi:Fuc2NAc and GlcNAc transferase